MPRAEARGTSAGTTGGARAGAETLRAVVEGLIARVEASPLMGRPPTACSPEEQSRLVTVLTGLSELRTCQTALAGVPDVRLALVAEVWPELAAVLASSGASRRAAPPRERDGSGGTRRVAAPRATERPAPDPSAPAPDPASRDAAESALAMPATAESAAAAPIRATPARAAPSRATPTRAAPGDAPDLRAAVRSVLGADTRPLSGARIASLVQEVAPQTTRDQVYDTLYRSADLFRKTSHGWELISR